MALREMHDIPPPTIKEYTRFWRKVNKTEECWIWVGARTNKGYGHAWIRGRVCYAHRTSYTWANGPIPRGMTLDHLCRNRAFAAAAHPEWLVERTEVAVEDRAGASALR